jgi:hypothetical protein
MLYSFNLLAGVLGDPQFFVLESRDDDRETRVFDPVLFSMPGGNLLSGSLVAFLMFFEAVLLAGSTQCCVKVAAKVVQVV